MVVEGQLQRTLTADPKSIFDQASVAFSQKVTTENVISPQGSPRKSQISDNSNYSEYTDFQYTKSSNLRAKRFSNNSALINLKDDQKL